ncbi:Gfo/Idh/MocA family protein [Halobacterium hubeiense]|uniref:Gfo/Idh/MocA family protein n=1 Tax=Halobacterium hubeiense TaxID=1407499 RepID=UPI003C7910DB
MGRADSPVRVGIVGLGSIGHHHAERLTGLGETLVGGVDVAEPARERFEAEYGVPTFETFEELDDAGVDAVVVTTPNAYHEQYVVAALDAGADVLCEKPLANTLESAERIAEAARDADASCMVGFNSRFLPAAEVLAETIADGELGDVTHVEANYVRRRGVPGRGGWFTTKDVSGGGALVDIGVHAIDLALHFLDFPEVVEVSGETRSEFGTREDYTYLDMWGNDAEDVVFDVDDHATAFVRTAEGQTLSLEVAWAANRPPNNEFVVEGTEGGATLDRNDGALTIHEVGDGGAAHFRDTDVETREEDAHALEQQYFFDAVREGEPIERNTVDQALAVQRVVDAVYRSADAGRAITL